MGLGLVMGFRFGHGAWLILAALHRLQEIKNYNGVEYVAFDKEYDDEALDNEDYDKKNYDIDLSEKNNKY